MPIWSVLFSYLQICFRYACLSFHYSFQAENFTKLRKPVKFPEILNMTPYMSHSSDKDPLYSLYAVVVHLDVSSPEFSGHYVCYVKTYSDEWFKIDDSVVCIFLLTPEKLRIPAF